MDPSLFRNFGGRGGHGRNGWHWCPKWVHGMVLARGQWGVRCVCSPGRRTFVKTKPWLDPGLELRIFKRLTPGRFLASLALGVALEERKTLRVLKDLVQGEGVENLQKPASACSRNIPRPLITIFLVLCRKNRSLSC